MKIIAFDSHKRYTLARVERTEELSKKGYKFVESIPTFNIIHFEHFLSKVSVIKRNKVWKIARINRNLTNFVSLSYMQDYT